MDPLFRKSRELPMLAISFAVLDVDYPIFVELHDPRMLMLIARKGHCPTSKKKKEEEKGEE
jgi:hypothetical protein